MSLNSYRARVEQLARKMTGEPIYNGSLDHAAVIIENIFANASREISILSKNLNARVYGRDEVIKQALLFLGNSNHKIRILMEEDSEDYRSGHPFFRGINESPNVEVLPVPSDLQDKYAYHFIVMDNNSYRFEADKAQPSAIAAFGDEDGAKNLHKIFDQMWDDARQQLNAAT